MIPELVSSPYLLSRDRGLAPGVSSVGDSVVVPAGDILEHGGFVAGAMAGASEVETPKALSSGMGALGLRNGRRRLEFPGPAWRPGAPEPVDAERDFVKGSFHGHAGVDGCAPVVRHRLRGKRPTTVGVDTSGCSAGSTSACPPAKRAAIGAIMSQKPDASRSGVSADAFAVPSNAWTAARQKMKGFLLQAWSRESASLREMRYRQRAVVVQQAMAMITSQEKGPLLEWCRSGGPDSHSACPVRWVDVAARVSILDVPRLLPTVNGSSAEIPSSRDHHTKRQKGVLFTYHGTWGSDVSAVQALMCSEMSLQQLVLAVRRLDFYSVLWLSFQKHVLSRMQEFQYPYVSMSMEITKSRKKPANLVHLHAYVSDPVHAHRRPDDVLWSFQSARPHTVFTTERGRSNCTRALNQGHWYAQVPKDGMVHSVSNWVAARDFSVPLAFIEGLWSKKKLSHASAAILAWDYRVIRAAQFQTNMEGFINRDREEEVLEEMRVVHASLPYRPFRTLREVERWREVYDNADLRGQAFRFKVLVLVGESRLGKTRFAVHLWGRENTLVVGCQNCGDEPYLKSFSRKKHRAILFDECPASLVVANKQIFQAGLDEVRLGMSRTAQWSYVVWLHGIALIISTNEWPGDGVSAGDRAWLRENCVVVNVSEPLYETG